MPELPEVDHARVLIQKNLVHKRVLSVDCALDDNKVIRGCDPKDVNKELKGLQVRYVKRKGKYLYMKLDNGLDNHSTTTTTTTKYVLVHFGMTGSFVVKGIKPASYKSFTVDEDTWPPRFCKVRISFTDGTQLAFLDARRFGRFVVSQEDPEATPPISELGPDALLDLPDEKQLREMLLRRKRAKVKAVLLDQGFVSGIGNWVGDEVLYQSALHPEQPCESLTEAQVSALHGAISSVLGVATEVEAESSKFPPRWLFHYRWTGKKRARIEGVGEVKFLTVGGRTTAFVPAVQRKTSVRRPKEEVKVEEIKVEEGERKRKRRVKR